MPVCRILVTGSRNWTDRESLRDALVSAVNDLRESGDTCQLVVGDCPTGADLHAAELWGHWRGVYPGWFDEAEVHRADWRGEGRSAGPKRNGRMVDAGADLCLAFPLGRSSGTRDCMKRAEAAGIPVRTLEPQPCA